MKIQDKVIAALTENENDSGNKSGVIWTTFDDDDDDGTYDLTGKLPHDVSIDVVHGGANEWRVILANDRYVGPDDLDIGPDFFTSREDARHWCENTDFVKALFASLRKPPKYYVPRK